MRKINTGATEVVPAVIDQSILPAADATHTVELPANMGWMTEEGFKAYTEAFLKNDKVKEVVAGDKEIRKVSRNIAEAARDAKKELRAKELETVAKVAGVNELPKGVKAVTAHERGKESKSTKVVGTLEIDGKTWYVATYIPHTKKTAEVVAAEVEGAKIKVLDLTLQMHANLSATVKA